jgi:DNA-binding transcriptional MerR regulator
MSSRAQGLYGAVQLAGEFGITPRALRFYETKGLITPRRVGSRRVYDYRDRARLELILRSKRLGFSLAEIREYLELYDAEPQQIGQLRRLEGAVGARIADLEVQLEALESTLEELRGIHDQVRAALRERGECAAADTGRTPSTTRDEAP